MDKATYRKAMDVLHALLAKIHEAADTVEASKHCGRYEPKQRKQQ